MKIIHTSDWHLGQNFYGNERTEEHLFFLKQLCAIVDEEEKTISYVYLQLINKDHLCLEDVYVPNGYDQQMEGSEFTVYSVTH